MSHTVRIVSEVRIGFVRHPDTGWRMLTDLDHDKNVQAWLKPDGTICVCVRKWVRTLKRLRVVTLKVKS
jgi:hypothetical protein